MSTQIIFDFNKNADVKNWNVVLDGVMGGRSSGYFELNEDGFGEFGGEISLANNGGFSSVRYTFDKMEVKDDSKIILKVRGDGKNYQFRIKHKNRDYYSYITSFETSGEWEEITIELKDMYPSFRGRKLNQPNFSHDYIEEVVFLIGNKKQEAFKLLIDEIVLQ